MTYDQAKEIRANIEERMQPSEQALKSLPKGEMGLVPDSHKSEFRKLNSEFQYWWKQYQTINKYIAKHFKKEHYAEMMAKRQRQMANAI